MGKEITPGKAELIAKKKNSEAMLHAMCNQCGEEHPPANECCPDQKDSEAKKYIKMKKAAAEQLMEECNRCNAEEGCCNHPKIHAYPNDATTDEMILMAIENNGRRLDAILDTMCCQHEDMQKGLVGIVQIIASCFKDLCDCVCPGQPGRVTTDDAVFIKPQVPESSCGCD